MWIILGYRNSFYFSSLISSCIQEYFEVYWNCANIGFTVNAALLRLTCCWFLSESASKSFRMFPIPCWRCEEVPCSEMREIVNISVPNTFEDDFSISVLSTNCMKLTTRVQEFCFTFKEICFKEKMTNAFSRADGDFHLDWKVIK